MRVCGIVMLLAAACTDLREAPSDVPHIIRNDGGGQLLSAEVDRARLAAWGKPVEIHGYCASACTMFTTLPNVCINRDARIGFHGADMNVAFVGNRQMAKYLRGFAKQRFVDDWQNIPQDKIFWLTAVEYQHLDPQIRICG